MALPGRGIRFYWDNYHGQSGFFVLELSVLGVSWRNLSWNCPGQRKNPKFSWNKFNFFPKKILSWKWPWVFLFVRGNCLDLRFLGEVSQKKKIVLDKIFQDNPRTDSSRTKIRTTQLSPQKNYIRGEPPQYISYNTRNADLWHIRGTNDTE